MMLVTQITVTGITAYFFWKVLTTKSKPATGPDVDPYTGEVMDETDPWLGKKK